MFGISEKIMGIIAGASLGAAVIFGGMYWFLDIKYDKLQVEATKKITEANAATNTALEANVSLGDTIDKLEIQAITNAANLKATTEEMSVIRKERDNVNKKYDSYRSQLPGLLAAKGSRIATLSNRATRVLVLQIEASTCRAGCDKNENSKPDDTVKPKTNGN